MSSDLFKEMLLGVTGDVYIPPAGETPGSKWDSDPDAPVNSPKLGEIKTLPGVSITGHKKPVNVKPKTDYTPLIILGVAFLFRKKIKRFFKSR